MRTVSLTVDTNGAVTPNTISGGHEGEHNVTSLDFTLASELLSVISFFRLSMGDYVSEELYPENNKITYPLPQCVMFANNLLIQLEGYKENDVGEIQLVFKSDIVSADIKPSIVASHEIPEELNPSIDTAVAKLSYYVENSDQLSKHIDGVLQETKEVIEQANESFEIKSNEYMREMNDMLIDGRRILYETAATLQSKADYATTLKGYGIKDAYTKTETDIMLLEKANLNGVYTKDEIDNALSCGMVEEYKSETAMFKTYYYSDALTQKVTQYLYIEHPEPLMPNAKYKLKFDCFYDLTEVKNFCVCVGDIHHPVIQNIPPTNGDFETYTFIEFAEFSLPETVSATDKIFFRFDMVRDPIARDVPYTLFASRLLPCYSKSEVDGLLESKADSSALPTKVSDLENDSGYLVASDIESKADSSALPTKVSDLENDSGYLLVADIESKANSSDIPTKVSELENDNGYLVASDIESKADKTKTVVFNDIHPLELADNTIYYAEEISQLSIEYPEGDFMCSLTFTLSDIEDLDVTVTLPGTSKYIGGAPTFAKGETWELNIKNGVVVGGLIE